MHSLLSLLSSAVLVAMVYGLSFFPSAALGQIDEVEQTITRAGHNGVPPDAQDAQGQSDAV